MAYHFDVLGLGVASLDFIGVAAQPPTLGAKQPVAEWLEAGGGPVPTAMVTLARLGLRTCMAGAVGDDMYGQRVLDDLQQAGVATDGMQVRPGRTHVAFVLAEPKTDRRTIWWYHDRSVFDTLELDADLVRSARVLHVDTHLPYTAIRAARVMQAAGGLVMLDAERIREGTLELLALCDVPIVSENFSRAVTGEADPALAAWILHERYGRLIVVTSGERGSWCVGRGESFHTPAFQVDVQDTTAPGMSSMVGFSMACCRAGRCNRLSALPVPRRHGL